MNPDWPMHTKVVHRRRVMDGCISSGSVSLRDDLGWPVTFELRFPPINSEDSTP